MSRAVVAVVALVVAGCSASQRPCRETAQCEAGDTCQKEADDDVGVCVKDSGEGEGDGGDEGEGDVDRKSVV